MSNYLTNIALRKAVDRLQQPRLYADIPYLTLTRTNTLAVTTAGTIITWESETRNSGFTWSGTDITIPANGYYAIQVACNIAISSGLNIARIVNGIGIDMTPPVPAGTYFPVSNISYYTSGTILQISVGVGTNTTLLVNAEDTANESPILHITQLVGVTL